MQSAQRQEQQQDSYSLPERPLFIAAGRPAFPFTATESNVRKIIAFFRTFPLSTAWRMSDEEIIEFLLSPHVIGIEIGNALVLLSNTVPGFRADIEFLFFDNRVTGNEGLVKDVCVNMMGILKLRRMQAIVPMKNRVTWRLFERIGFRPEGRLRNAFVLPTGDLGDIVILSLLPEDLK